MIIDDKILEQLEARGWTEQEVLDLIDTKPVGRSSDNRTPRKTGDGGGRRDTATVYGSRDGGHIVVNDRTGEVVHISDKNDPYWKSDSRIIWE
ncbi:hypothetical protein CR152_12490 [Massilia violaceinigra]|uniref:Colicin E5 ribonuclease domain-containing protein n=1 Tax=Massilia violaceinigra TaxID=2045208 RepID=A0A2D2DJW5_9BURK|nr:colicin E5-related ribonuclease [Massilia violaceinigra]ATQ75245.1 hypothetical protein CR152_12490 [Massilia violaceinigra]